MPHHRTRGGGGRRDRLLEQPSGRAIRRNSWAGPRECFLLPPAPMSPRRRVRVPILSILALVLAGACGDQDVDLEAGDDVIPPELAEPDDIPTDDQGYRRCANAPLSAEEVLDLERDLAD